MEAISPTQWWLIAGIALLILEIFTPAFFAAALSLGCFITALFTFFGVSFEVSWLIFSACSILGIVYIRPLAKKLYKGKAIKTNADAMIGRLAIAETDLTNSRSDGYVKLDGVSWKAILAETSEPVFKGDQVKVVSYESIVLKVKKV